MSESEIEEDIKKDNIKILKICLKKIIDIDEVLIINCKLKIKTERE